MNYLAVFYKPSSIADPALYGCHYKDGNGVFKYQGPFKDAMIGFLRERNSLRGGIESATLGIDEILEFTKSGLSRNKAEEMDVIASLNGSE